MLTDQRLHEISELVCNEIDRLQPVISTSECNQLPETIPQALQIGHEISCNPSSEISSLDMRDTEEAENSCRQNIYIGTTSPLLSHTDDLGEGYFGVLARHRRLNPNRCPRCGSANIIPSFTVLEAWECWATGCMRPFCPND